MDSGITQLDHYEDTQTTIQVQHQQATTSNGGPSIQLHRDTTKIQDSGNSLQQQCHIQTSQQIFSQPAGTESNLGTTYHVTPQSSFASNVQQPQPLPQLPESLQHTAQQSKNPYQFKCSLLEYHLHEAVLVNKALRSELQEYKEKIAFEKKLRSVLIDRLKTFTSG